MDFDQRLQSRGRAVGAHVPEQGGLRPRSTAPRRAAPSSATTSGLTGSKTGSTSCATSCASRRRAGRSRSSPRSPTDRQAGRRAPRDDREIAQRGITAASPRRDAAGNTLAAVESPVTPWQLIRFATKSACTQGRRRRRRVVLRSPSTWCSTISTTFVATLRCLRCATSPCGRRSILVGVYDLEYLLRVRIDLFESEWGDPARPDRGADRQQRSIPRGAQRSGRPQPCPAFACWAAPASINDGADHQDRHAAATPQRRRLPHGRELGGAASASRRRCRPRVRSTSPIHISVIHILAIEVAARLVYTGSATEGASRTCLRLVLRSGRQFHAGAHLGVLAAAPPAGDRRRSRRLVEGRARPPRCRTASATTIRRRARGSTSIAAWRAATSCSRTAAARPSSW